MPKSKRNKIVHLTKVKKKGKDHKEDLMKQVEQYIATFRRVFVFDFDQTKSDRIMNLRMRLKEYGRIFAGKNAVVISTFKSIGSKTNTDYEDLLKQVTGHRGLLFADIECDKLVELLDREQPEFCKKLLGYSRIGAESKSTESETGPQIDDGGSGTKLKRKKVAKREARKSSGKRVIKFVKI